ncbi:MAG: PilN domain-containing protein [Patescibacteria group bacterium]
MQSRVQQIGSLSINQDFAVPLLHHLETITPLGVTFSNFIFSDGKISITATANTNNAFALFLGNLTNSTLLRDVTVTNLNQKTTATNGITFQVEAVTTSQDNSKQTAKR